MELKKFKQNIASAVSKYKYPVLVGVLGLLLMLLPNMSPKEDDSLNTQAQTIVETITVEQRLEQILRQIHGAGNVSVMLMEGAGEEVIYQSNTSTDQDSQRSDTVTVTDSERNQTGLIKQKYPPKYAGAIIVCDGAGDPEVCLKIVNAVSCVTGLGSNRISVLKMK